MVGSKLRHQAIVQQVRQTQAAKLGIPLNDTAAVSDPYGSRDYYYSFLSITTYTASTATTTTVGDRNLLNPHWRPHGSTISERIPAFKASASMSRCSISF